MKRRRVLGGLGETEMEVLQVVWDLGEATVGDVLDRLRVHRTVAYTTVMTVLRKLADKGYLSFYADGAAYVYRAAVPPEEVKHGLLKGMLDQVFGGSPAALVQTLVDRERLTSEDREHIRKLIEGLGYD